MLARALRTRMKLVSVIIPAYNVESYIAATVQSVLDQTYPEIEVLIVDDGSCDRTVEVCEQIGDARIKILTQSNRGAAGARNTGIRHIQGEYVAFLDADDLWLPEKLETQIQHLESNPSVGISFSYSSFIDADGEPLGIYQTAKLRDFSLKEVLCRNPIGNGSTPVLRRQVLENIKFEADLYGQIEEFYFDESLSPSEDTELWFRIFVQTNWEIQGIPEALTLYRIYSQGTSANLDKKQRSWEKLIDKIHTYAPELAPQLKDPANAYHLRYLTRRAVSLRDGSTAVKFVNQAISTYWQIFLEEPRRTGLTLAAAYLLNFLPSSLYKQMESVAMYWTGLSQKRKMQTER